MPISLNQLLSLQLQGVLPFPQMIWDFAENKFNLKTLVSFGCVVSYVAQFTLVINVCTTQSLLKCKNHEVANTFLQPQGPFLFRTIIKHCFTTY